MSTPNKGSGQTQRSHRPRAFTVFAAAFVAGAAAAVGLNRALDVHLAQAKPQIEQEPIFVALRSLPQGSPVTVWDVALREWPKAMLPTTAMRATDSFDGLVVKYPLREGQPVLSVQLARTPASSSGPLVAQPPQTVEHPATIASERVAQPARVDPAPQADLWTPADQASSTAIQSPSDRMLPDPAPSKQSPSTPTLRPTPVQATPVATTVAATPASSSSTADRSTAADIDGPTTADLEPWTGVPAAAPSKPKDPVVRYLVVPEHIAAQADLSFVTPSQPQQPPAAATSAPQKAANAKAATVKASTARAPSAQTAMAKTTIVKPGVAKPVQPSAARQQAARAKSPSAQPQGKARQTPSQTTGSAQTGSRLDSMFPNLAAGIDAVEIELRRIRRERGRQPDAADQDAGTATPNAQQQPAKAARSPAQPPDRSASRP